MENQNYHFLTALSGLLLALIFGYYDHESGNKRTFPQLGDFWPDKAPAEAFDKHTQA